MSPSDAALCRQLERHTSLQKARLLALATGRPELSHPAPATPAASPLAAPEDAPTRQRSGDSGRCHALCQLHCSHVAFDMLAAANSRAAVVDADKALYKLTPPQCAGLSSAERRTAMTRRPCAAPAAPCRRTRGGRRPRSRRRRGRTCGGRPRPPSAAGDLGQLLL